MCIEIFWNSTYNIAQLYIRLNEYGPGGSSKMMPIRPDPDSQNTGFENLSLKARDFYFLGDTGE